MFTGPRTTLFDVRCEVERPGFIFLLTTSVVAGVVLGSNKCDRICYAQNKYTENVRTKCVVTIRLINHSALGYRIQIITISYFLASSSRHVAQPAVTRFGCLSRRRSLPGRSVAVDSIGARLAASTAGTVAFRSARIRSGPAHADATRCRQQITG